MYSTVLVQVDELKGSSGPRGDALLPGGAQATADVPNGNVLARVRCMQLLHHIICLELQQYFCIGYSCAQIEALERQVNRLLAVPYPFNVPYS